MRLRPILLFVICTVASLSLPLAAHAAIPFFGPIIPDDINRCPLGWGAVMVVVNRIIELLITVAIVFVAPLMIAYAGFLFVVNPVNAEGIGQAKGILKNTVVGIVIALAGWLIVDAIFVALTNQGLGGWSALVGSRGAEFCIEQKAVNAPTPGSTGITTSQGGLNEQGIRDQLASAGVSINNAACPVGSTGQGCTNVGGMRPDTVSQIIAIKNACGSGCAVVVTGGTEPGHAVSATSHGEGFKVDLRPNAQLDAYLKSMKSIGTRVGDGPGEAYTDKCGSNQYVRESDHWDIKITSACVPPK